MQKKNLWIINHYATPPQYGGLNRHHYFAKFLNKYDFETEIVASSAIHNSTVNFISKKSKYRYKKHKVDGVKYLHIKTRQYKGNKFGRVINILQFYFRTIKTLKKLPKPDYIYTSSPQPLSAILGIRIAKKLGVPCITEIRDLWPASLLSYKVIKGKNIIYKILYLLEKYIYLNSDKIVFTMEKGINYLKEQKYVNKVDLGKVYYLNNGVDLLLFSANKKEFKIKDDDIDNTKTFKVVYTGSLRYIYDILKIAKVAKIIQDRGYKDIVFLIYGTGTYEESLLEYIKTYKIKNILFKGFIDNKYLPYILSKCDLNLLHGKSTFITKYGMSANKTFLYLASGKPIISTYQEEEGIIEKYKCGLVVDSEKVDDYVAKILYFYNISSEEYKEFSENCLKTAKLFDYKNLTKKLTKILEE